MVSVTSPSGHWCLHKLPRVISPSLREGRASARGGPRTSENDSEYMTRNRPDSLATNRARSLRRNQTRSEGLLWSILRTKQLCGLKFRREHRVGPWITDFACVERMLVVEIDGGYHDETVADDLRRQENLQQLGWTVIRFADDDVEKDTEAVGRAIANVLGIPYELKKRQSTGSGMQSARVSKKHKPNQPSPR